MALPGDRPVRAWSCAGVGAASLAGRLRRRLPPLPAAALALGAVAAAIAAALAEPPSPIAAAAIRTPAAPSDLGLAEALRALLPGEAATGLAGPGRSDLYPWALALGCRCRIPVDQPDLTAAGSPQAARAMVAAWLAASPADRIVAVDPPAAHALPGAVGWEDRRRAVAEALAAQDLFRPAAAAVAPDGTRLQLYLRRPDAPRPPAPRRLHLLDGLALLLGLAVIALLLLPARRPAPVSRSGAPGRP
ncbi:MAG: hypothetical protein U1E53_31875 [Dongiaceae bacterium]